MTTFDSKAQSVVPVPIRFQSFSEVQARPRWRDGLDPSKHKLVRIIGDYSFSKADEIRCGLKTCRSAHMNGYVVETEDNLERHIGNRCGTNHFGVSWGQIRSVFNRATEERDRQEWLNSILVERDRYLHNARSLLERTANASESINEILSQLQKEAEVYNSFLLALRKGGLIQVERVISPDTVEVINLPLKQQRILETVGRFFGVEALPRPWSGSPGVTILAKLRSQAIPTFVQLSTTSLKNLNGRQRKERTREIEEAKLILKDAENYIASASTFLSRTNLRELGKLPVTRKNQRTERILRRFSSAD